MAADSSAIQLFSASVAFYRARFGLYTALGIVFAAAYIALRQLAGDALV